MNTAFQVGPWLVEPSLNSISRNGATVRLEPKVMELLVCLAASAGETLSKEDLLQNVWPDTFVSDDALKHCISELRRVFEDDAREPCVIQTIARRGYRFIAAVDRARVATRPPSPSLARDSIAVLPFVNISADPENEFFADGITEEIINALAQIEDLQVVARSSAFSFKGKHIDPRIVGEQLNVRTLLEGSVRKAGNCLRITVQLVNASDGFHLWSERYDREMKDVFAVQDEIARSIAERLKVTFRTEQGPLVKAGTKNLEAYQLYLKGRALLYRRGGATSQAVKCFEQAVDLDAQYALGWAGLSESYATLGHYGLAAPQPSMSKAMEAAKRAVVLGPAVAETHHALGMASLLAAWNKADAEREFVRALELNPRNMQARAWYALNYLQLAAGRLQEGLSEAKLAIESDRRSSYAHAMCSWCYCMLGQHAEAVRTARTAVELDPESYIARLSLQGGLQMSGAFEECIAVAESALAMSGRHCFAMAGLALALADWGKPAEADAVYAEMLARARRQYQPPALLALAASAADKQDEAIAHARKALQNRDPSCPLILSRHFCETARLYRYPQFRELIVETDFEQSFTGHRH